MDLETYLRTTGTSGAAFAKRVGISAASVTRICQRRQNIKMDLAMRIVAETGGKVSLEALTLRSAA